MAKATVIDIDSRKTNICMSTIEKVFYRMFFVGLEMVPAPVSQQNIIVICFRRADVATLHNEIPHSLHTSSTKSPRTWMTSVHTC